MTNPKPSDTNLTASPLTSGPYIPQEVEAKWTEFCFGNNIYDLNIKAGHPFFSAALPPPNITGNLHMGHALNGTLQDVLFRYKRMQGFNVLWQPGTDHAGISGQMVVERKLKKEGKSRHDLGREAFIDQVWLWRNQYGNAIYGQYKKLGVSFAWNRLAFTMDESYVKAINKVFVQLFKEKLIYRGRRVGNWCPRCLTSISDLEVQHEEKSGFLYVIKYRLADQSGELLVATTRPETIFADVAVAVNPSDARYKQLVGKQVLLPLTNKPLPVIADSYVDKEFGTGALKITPAHDLNDFEVGQRHKLDMPIVIDEAGKLMNDPLVPTQYHGMERFAARQKIVEDLEAANLLVESKKHDNAISLCDRCLTVIEPRLSDQWYMSMKALVEPAIEAVEKKQIIFIPERYSATYLDWMHNIRDWCISRQLWWGQRIPVWTCSKCGEIDAFEEEPTACQKCGHAKLEQDPDVLDTWFSSGLFPFATLGWPAQTEEMANFYPTDILVTARDIINLWVSRMVFFSLKVVGKIPFKHVLIHPVIQTADGKRMSKSKGNAVDPLDMIAKYGADANRFWFTSIGLKGDQDVRFREDKLEEYKRFVNKLWNAGRFVISKIAASFSVEDSATEKLANIKNLSPENLSLADRWILSKYNKLLSNLHAAYETYDYQIIASELHQFTWDYFCDWYLEISKIDSSNESNKQNSAQSQTIKVLYAIFESLLRALHPIMPFVTEELYAQLTAATGDHLPRSVLFDSYPAADNKYIDNEAEEKMEFICQLIRSIRNIRQTYNIPHTSQIEAIFQSNGPRQSLIEQYSHYIEKLTISKLTDKANTNNIPTRCATDAVEQTSILIPLSGIIDIEKTKEKLLARKVSVEKDLLKTQQIMSSGDFTSKAPPEKVELVRKQLEASQSQISHLNAQLKVLD